MRLAAALVAFGLCLFIGCCADRRLKKRAENLRQLLGVLHSFEVRMRYTAPPLRELLEDCDAEFTRLALERSCGADIRGGWMAAAAELPYLNGSDRRLLQELGAVLGTSGAEGQLCYIGQTLAQLSELSKGADADRERLGKLYRTVGALAGAAAAIIII